MVALLAAGAVAWSSRSKDDGAATDSTELPDDSGLSGSTTPATVAPGSTVAPTVSVVGSTVPALTLPIPGTTIAVAPTVAPPPALPIPEGSVLASDPAGWTLAVDPAWNDTTSNGIRTFFINPGTTTGDNVNVSTEALAAPVTLDAYVAAAITNIQTAAPDFVIVSQEQQVGPDGVPLELIGWSGTLSGLPKLSFLQSIVVSPTTAYISTFTSLPETMPNMAPFLQPFLITLRGA
ncbi:MAG: hypothetical protein RLZZ623_342 [Actinomycetota bacterium]